MRVLTVDRSERVATVVARAVALSDELRATIKGLEEILHSEKGEHESV